MAKKNPLEPVPASIASVQHTFRVPTALENRIRRCMKLAGFTDFTAYAITSMIARCPEIEKKHGIDAEGNALK